MTAKARLARFIQIVSRPECNIGLRSPAIHVSYRSKMLQGKRAALGLMIKIRPGPRDPRKTPDRQGSPKAIRPSARPKGF